MKRYAISFFCALVLAFFPGLAWAGGNETYFHIDGTYVLPDAGGGIQNGFDPALVHQGRGVWASGYIGHTFGDNWDWRLGGGYAGLGAGQTHGSGSNIYGIDRATMWNLDTDIGYDLKSNGVMLRPSLGLRYLNWDQYQGFHPDAPLGCCWMDSTFSGIGPKAAIDTEIPLSGSVNFVAGINAAVLFGNINYTTGSKSPSSSGAQGLTALSAGGYAGFDVAISRQLSLGLRYNLLYLSGTSYGNQHLFSKPDGTGTNLLNGPSASLTVKF